MWLLNCRVWRGAVEQGIHHRHHNQGGYREVYIRSNTVVKHGYDVTNDRWMDGTDAQINGK